MATLVATSPSSLTMNGIFAQGHSPQSPAYPPPRPVSPQSPVVNDEPMPLAASRSININTNTNSDAAPASGQTNASSTPFLRGGGGSASVRPAKDLAAFNSLLPPPIEFVEGSSSGMFAANFEGRYEPINASPKAAPKVLSDTKVKSPPTKKTSIERKESTSLYTRPIDMSWPTGVVHGSGLFNQGNTCFLNSALQCLLHTPPLIRILLSHTKAECQVKSGFCMSCAMRQVLHDSFQKGRAFTPLPITRNLNSIAKHLRKGRQEDAHEFLRYAIDSLQKSCLAGYPPKLDHKIAETTWVHKIFGGRLRSRVTCQQCGYNSDTFDSILDLSIDIYNMAGLKEALRKFTAKDYLKGADKYKCDQCKRPVNAEKQFTVHDAPAVLTVHFKRFTPMGRKLQHPVRYDERISLQPTMSEGQHGPTYTLYGVISHMGGGPNSGHYFAHVRGGDGQWYEMNDDSVERARRPEPLNMKNAYMLFYIREKGQTLAAAVNTVGLVNGVNASKKRKSPVEYEREPADESMGLHEATRPIIGPVIPPHLRTPKSDPQSETLKRKIEAAERRRNTQVEHTQSRLLKALVDYEDDDDDEEQGEPVECERPNADMTRNNGADKGALRGSALMQSSSPSASPALRSESMKDENVNGDDSNEASSPARPPPTSPMPTTSPAETIAPSTFYGSGSSSNSSKRKSVEVPSSSAFANNDGDDPLRWKSPATVIATPSNSNPRRSLGGPSAGNPYGKSRIGDNLHVEREREDRELFRPRKIPKKQFGSRPKFSY